MQLSNLKLFTIITGLFLVASASAQSFQYDTVPDPRNNQPQLYKYELPERGNQQDRPLLRNQQTPAAEEKKSSFDKSKLLFGGSFGLTFGDYTSVNISPQIGYAFSRYFSAGFGVSYDYYKYQSQYLNYLGFNLYGRLNPISNINLQIQPEIFRMWGSNSIKKTVPCVLAGAGITMPIGNNAGISMMLYYDLVQDEYSPYFNQVVYSIGYVFYF